MQTFEQHIAELAERGLISTETAKALGAVPERKGRSRKGSSE
jgi:Tfp pilus assembly pilus retraction ATPase PilT